MILPDGSATKVLGLPSFFSLWPFFGLWLGPVCRNRARFASTGCATLF
jgi:hypothetical protein